MKGSKFWCSERVQRLVISIYTLIVLFFLAKGDTLTGLILLAFLSIMLFVYFAFDFCPSIWILNKIFGSCYEGRENEN